MRRREALLDKQASEQIEMAAQLAEERRQLDEVQRDLAIQLDEVERTKRSNMAMTFEIEAREDALSSREAEGARRDLERDDQQAVIETSAREIDQREERVKGFEVGIDAIARGELYFGRAKDGREGLLSKLTPERSKELGTQIGPALGWVRQIARSCSQAVSQEVEAEVAKVREVIASLMQAYQTAIEVARAHAEDFLHLLSKLRKEVRKRVMVDLDLQKGEVAARKTVSEGAKDSPEGLSLEQLEHMRRLRGGSQIR